MPCLTSHTPVFQQYLYYGRVDQSDASAACPGNYNTFRQMALATAPADDFANASLPQVW